MTDPRDPRAEAERLLKAYTDCDFAPEPSIRQALLVDNWDYKAVELWAAAPRIVRGLLDQIATLEAEQAEVARLKDERGKS